MSGYARRISTMDSEVRKLKVLTDTLVSPNIVSFAGGAPGREAYPFEILKEISQDIFQADSRGFDAVKYGASDGYLPLREAIKNWLLTPRGLRVDVSNIFITSGGIQAMNLLAQLYINPGDVILVESPSFVHASMIFKMFEAKLVPCAMDHEGLILSDVEEKIRRYSPKMIYTVPTFHNPTGVTLSLDRRNRLAELGSQYDLIILEDDPYREIRYSGDPLPYIKTFDTTGNTILCNSFSKIFSPGSRLGYIVADKKILDILCSIRLGTDTCPNTFAQVICAEFFTRGYYPDHLKKLCHLYRQRRDAMVQAIDKHFPPGTTYTIPDGGFYVWVELPDGLNASALRKEVADKLNLCYGDGSIFFTEGNPSDAGCRCMRLNFSGLDEETIAVYLQKLGVFLSQKLSEVVGHGSSAD